MFKFSDLFYPINYSCYVCGMDVFDNPYFICDDCKKNLPYLEGKICIHCGEPLVSDGNYCKRCKGKVFIIDRAFAPFIYKDNAVSLVYNLKYNSKKYVAKCMAKFMADYFKKSKLYADYIIPVPLCDKRFKQRGYNQSEELAKEISKLLNINIKLDCLKRVKETPTQTNLDYSERQINLKDAFKVYKSKCLNDKTILLIDDVYTTGATTKECARVLKNAGANCVYVLTFAHTVIKDD